jgi:moderate conductance mechanosensitive channel
MSHIVLPPLDILIHNLVAVLAALVLVLLLSELMIALILRASNVLLRAAIFDTVTAEERVTLRRRVRRRTLVVVAFIALALLAGAVLASFEGYRALDLVRGFIVARSGEDFASLRANAIKVAGIVAVALIADVIARGFAGALGKGLSTSTWLVQQREPLADVNDRLRTALRALILCGAFIFVSRALLLPEEAQRVVTIGAYGLATFYLARLVVSVAYIVVDLLFDTSTRLSTFESPLRHLGGLKHLAGLTKRTVDYFVYVGAATVVANELTPDTWIARAGGVGIRIIAIFYTSRVLVELCTVFVREIFLTKTDDVDSATMQQRQTLVPVAMGLVRYGIYFCALLMALRAADIDTTPLLAGAGVLGVAVGLGAQAFVGDIVAGFFILFENLLLVGDLVEVAKVRGYVEEIGVRITKIRDEAGVLHAIPNGEVRKVANHSKGFVNAVVDVHVPYEEDPRRVRALLTSLAEQTLFEETGQRGPLDVVVEELTEGSILYRVSARVPPGKNDDVGYAMRVCIVEGLRREGVGAPRARRAVIIDTPLQVKAPSASEDDDDDDEGPAKPFEAPQASD